VVAIDAFRQFSVDDFEAAKTTAWEGVRNYAARNIMQSMKAGEKVISYAGHQTIMSIIDVTNLGPILSLEYQGTW